MLKKLTSRKFICAAIVMVAGIVSMLCGHETEVKIIADACMVIIPAIVYCIMEGRVDAASVKAITDAAETAAEDLGNEDAAETIHNIGFVAESLSDEEDQ